MLTGTTGTFQRSGLGGAIGPAPTAMLVTPPLIGRERDVERVLALLDNDHLRVLTLIGPGGVRKTRLALEVMRQVGDDYAHGVGFVSLAPIRQPELVPVAVTGALGLRESGTTLPADLLVEWLRSRHVLLVLDNMEQVVEAVHPWLSGLISSCPRLTVLVTSRIALDIASEQRYRVAPFPVPPAGVVDRLDENAAVALFVRRAREVRNDFEPDDEALRAIAAICRRLDGLPLAIELAAARTNVFSPAEFLDRLTDTFSLLAGTRRDAPPRLRSLHDAVAWSYDLLDPAGQALFRRLAVFNGGFSLDAAEAMVASLSFEMTAANRVSVLTDHSLVERFDDRGGTRFRMLETIREFGIVQLRDLDELHAARDAHAAYCLALANTAGTGLRGPQQVTWYDRTETEHVNLSDAMAWLTSCGRVADAVDLYCNIELFLLARAHYAECRALLEGWLAALDPGDKSRTRARVLDSLGALSIALEDVATGKEYFLEALEMFREIDDLPLVMETLGAQSFLWRIEGDLDRARSANAESLALASELGDARGKAMALIGAAGIAECAGDPHATRLALDVALTAAREAGLLVAVAHVLGNIADLVFDQDHDSDRARELLEEARMLLERVGDKRNLPFRYFSLARIEQESGNFGQARARPGRGTGNCQGNRPEWPSGICPPWVGKAGHVDRRHA